MNLSFGPTVSFIHRVARAASPPARRPWVDAFFGELDVIDGLWPRFVWLIGTAQLVLSGSKRAALQGTFTFLALSAAVFFGALFLFQYEGAKVDDDLFAVLAGISAAISAGLFARTFAHGRSLTSVDLNHRRT